MRLLPNSLIPSFDKFIDFIAKTLNTATIAANLFIDMLHNAISYNHFSLKTAIQIEYLSKSKLCSTKSQMPVLSLTNSKENDFNIHPLSCRQSVMEPLCNKDTIQEESQEADSINIETEISSKKDKKVKESNSRNKIKLIPHHSRIYTYTNNMEKLYQTKKPPVFTTTCKAVQPPYKTSVAKHKHQFSNYQFTNKFKTPVAPWTISCKQTAFSKKLSDFNVSKYTPLAKVSQYFTSSPKSAKISNFTNSKSCISKQCFAKPIDKYSDFCYSSKLIQQGLSVHL